MTRDEAFRMLDLICTAQAKREERPLKFLLTVDVLNDLEHPEGSITPEEHPKKRVRDDSGAVSADEPVVKKCKTWPPPVRRQSEQ